MTRQEFSQLLYGENAQPGEPSAGGSGESAVIALLEAVREAQRAVRDKKPSLAESGSLIELYGVSLQLSATTGRIREFVTSDLNAGDESGDLRLRYERDREKDRLYSQMFSQIRTFEKALSQISIATIDIYYPGLAHLIVGASGLDSDIEYYYNIIATSYDLQRHRIPASLRRLGQDSRWGGHERDWHQDRIGGVADEIIGNAWVTHGPEFERKLTRLFEVLTDCSRLVADIVREHWTFKEVADPSSFEKTSLEVVMGDKFEHVHNSTIYNRSVFSSAFNKIKTTGGDDVASALAEVAEAVAQSGNKDAGEMFDSFNEEAQQEKPRKSVLKATWDSLVTMVPGINAIAGAAARIVKLFS